MLFKLPSFKISLSCSSLHLKGLFLLLNKCMVELIKSTNTSITNFLGRDLARVRKSCKVLYHANASINLYIYWLSHFNTNFRLATFVLRFLFIAGLKSKNKTKKHSSPVFQIRLWSFRKLLSKLNIKNCFNSSNQHIKGTCIFNAGLY